MNYDKFHKLLEEPNAEKKQVLFERAMEGLSLPVQRPASNRRRSIKNFKRPARLAACISMAVAVACLAIILPFAVNQGGVQPATPIQEERYVEAAACNEIKLDYSLKVYSERNDLYLLYVNWYDVADVITSLNVDKKDKTDIVFYHETLMHKGTGSIVEFYISDTRTHVDITDEYRKLCKGRYITVNPRVNVFWGYDTAENGKHYTYVADFIYEKFHYTLVLKYPMYENDIFDLIDSVVPAVKRMNK